MYFDAHELLDRKIENDRNSHCLWHCQLLGTAVLTFKGTSCWTPRNCAVAISLVGCFLYEVMRTAANLNKKGSCHHSSWERLRTNHKKWSINKLFNTSLQFLSGFEGSQTALRWCAAWPCWQLCHDAGFGGEIVV